MVHPSCLDHHGLICINIWHSSTKRAFGQLPRGLQNSLAGGLGDNLSSWPRFHHSTPGDMNSQRFCPMSVIKGRCLAMHLVPGEPPLHCTAFSPTAKLWLYWEGHAKQNTCRLDVNLGVPTVASAHLSFSHLPIWLTPQPPLEGSFTQTVRSRDRGLEEDTVHRTWAPAAPASPAFVLVPRTQVLVPR